MTTVLGNIDSFLRFHGFVGDEPFFAISPNSGVKKNTSGKVAKMVRLFDSNGETLKNLSFVRERMCSQMVEKHNIQHVNRIEVACVDVPLGALIAQDGGKDLRDYINSDLKNRKRDETYLREVIRLSKQILEALSGLHAVGAAHSDIKPENIVVDPGNGQLKIIDLESIFMPGVPEMSSDVFTRAYLSADLLIGGEITEKNDIWAAGAVIFEMLSGLELSPGIPGISNMSEKTSRHFVQIFDRLAKVFSTEDRNLVNIIMKLSPYCEYSERNVLEPFDNVIQRQFKPKWSEMLVHFLVQMLQIRPDQRKSAAELLRDPIFERFSDQKIILSNKIPRKFSLEFGSKGKRLKLDLSTPFPPTCFHMAKEWAYPLKVTMKIPERKGTFVLYKGKKRSSDIAGEMDVADFIFGKRFKRQKTDLSLPC